MLGLGAHAPAAGYLADFHAAFAALVFLDQVFDGGFYALLDLGVERLLLETFRQAALGQDGVLEHGRDLLQRDRLFRRVNDCFDLRFDSHL